MNDLRTLLVLPDLCDAVARGITSRLTTAVDGQVFSSAHCSSFHLQEAFQVARDRTVTEQFVPPVLDSAGRVTCTKNMTASEVWEKRVRFQKLFAEYEAGLLALSQGADASVWGAVDNKRIEMEKAFDEYQKAGEEYEKQFQR